MGFSSKEYSGGVGSLVPAEVTDLIKKRELVYGGTTKLPEHLTAIHASTPWVLLRSGADVGKQQRVEKENNSALQLPPVENPKAPVSRIGDAPEYEYQYGAGDASEARKYILCGGHAIAGGGDGHFLQKSLPYLDPDSTGGPLGPGWRPIPGITSVSLKSKDTWGVIMEGVVNFTVADRVTLDHLDKLYFKPGFTVLLEFGHTIYVDRDLQIKKTVETVISHEDFFKPQPYLEMDEKVLDARASNCNYEAVLGQVTNFSWSIKANGTYDCSVTFVSKGSVLEGLTIKPVHTLVGSKDSGLLQAKADDLMSPFHVLRSALNSTEKLWTGGVEESEVTNIYNDSNKSVLEKVRVKPKTTLTMKPGNANAKVLSSRDSLIAYAKASKWNAPSGAFPDFPVIHFKTQIGHKRFLRGKPVGELNYMLLRDVILLLERWNVEEGDWLGFNYISSACYAHADGCFSLNPSVALKPMDLVGDYNLKEWDYLVQPTNLEALGDKNCQDPHRILNILVSVEEVISVIDSIVTSKDETYLVKDIIDGLLASIQKAFGNINEFGVHYNHNLQCLEIVDRRCINTDDGEQNRIRISGTPNTIRSFDIHSDVTDDMANMMSISAQAPTVNKEAQEGNAHEVFLYWNEGMVNRFSFTDDSTSNNSDSGNSESIFVDKVTMIYKILNNEASEKELKDNGVSTKNDKGEYSAYDFFGEVYGHIQVYGEKKFQALINKEFQEAEGQNGNPGNPGLSTGPIPYRATLTMKGIGGFVVGSVFSMDEHLLPSKYREWGNIITGVQHSVDKNGWWTTVETLYYPTLEAQKVGMQSSVQKFGAMEHTEAQLQSEAIKSPTYENNDVDGCDLYEEFTKRFTWDKSHGWCARYTAAWADAWVVGKSSYAFAGAANAGGLTTPQQGYGGVIGSSFVPTLQAKGWTVKGSYVFATDQAYAAWLQSTVFSAGDVIEMYGDIPGSKPKIHAQFYYPGKGRSGWQSDWPQGGIWPYASAPGKFNAKWTVKHLQAPPRHPDWCS